MNIKPYVEFHNGQRMPIVGLGTWRSSKEEIRTALTAALNDGYRHIDTAYVYNNETEIGEALKEYLAKGTLKREDLFIVSKLPKFGLHKERVEKYLHKSLERLQLKYLDLYLIHSPIGVQEVNESSFPTGPDGAVLLDKTINLEEVWKAMEEMVDSGLTKSIGLSNFNSRQIQRILDIARIPPANLQVECHAYLQQRKLFDFCKERGVTFCAYGPLGNPALGDFMKENNLSAGELPILINDPALQPLCTKHKKTAAQVLLRWLMQRGMVVIPKSINPSRIKENFQVFDFDLSEEDTKVIDSLDRNLRLFTFSPALRLDEHPEYTYSIEF